MTKEDKCCEKKKLCGSDKISIIDGSSGERVINPKEDNSPNFALSKMDFAECVLEKKSGFENIKKEYFSTDKDISKSERIFYVLKK